MEMNSKQKKYSAPLLYAGMVLFVFVLVLADQFTKHLAVLFLKNRPPVVLIPGILELQYLENRGAAFSMLQNRQGFFYVLTTIFLVNQANASADSHASGTGCRSLRKSD